jgi:hypothetical protein
VTRKVATVLQVAITTLWRALIEEAAVRMHEVTFE